MTRDEYLALFRQAAEAEYGIVVTVAVTNDDEDPPPENNKNPPGANQRNTHDPFPTDLDGLATARRFRRKLYYFRDQARRAGDHSFDELSVLVRRTGEVVIVRQDRLRNRIKGDGVQGVVRDLQGDELPYSVGARGPSRRWGHARPLP
jgi:hypothetical protein